MSNLLILGEELEGITTQDELKRHIRRSHGRYCVYDEKEDEAINLDGCEFFVAYQDYGDYEGASYFLFRGPDGQLYENHASHCSCYDFEDSWSPEPVTPDYLLSEHFNVYGYETALDRIRSHINLIHPVLTKGPT